MDSRTEINQHDLSSKIAHKVAINLSFNFWRANIQYKLTYPLLSEFNIYNEIFDTLMSLDFTPTQQSILSNGNSGILVQAVAGNLVKTGSFNIMTGEGVKCTGLTRLYFNSLDFKMRELTLDTIVTSFVNLPNESFKFATNNTLNGSFKERENQIISIFCSELAKLANYQQINTLWNERDDLRNQPVMKMRQPCNFLTTLFSGIKGNDSTIGAKLYFNTVLDLFCNSYPYWNLIAPTLLGIKNKDLSKYIFDVGFFSSIEKTQLAKTLPVVNKAAAVSAAKYKAEKEEYKKLRK